jgi:hypothetical protein
MITPMRTGTKHPELSGIDPFEDIDLDRFARTHETGSPGFLRRLLQLVALPFRLVGGAVGVVVLVVVGAARIVLFPIGLVVTVVGVLLGWAADITYALWRAVMAVVGAVVKTVLFVVGLVVTVVGGIVRLVVGTVALVVRIVVGIVTAPFRALAGVFRLGRRRGERKAIKEAAEPSDDAVVDIID